MQELNKEALEQIVGGADWSNAGNYFKEGLNAFGDAFSEVAKNISSDAKQIWNVITH